MGEHKLIQSVGENILKYRHYTAHEPGKRRDKRGGGSSPIMYIKGLILRLMIVQMFVDNIDNIFMHMILVTFLFCLSPESCS